MNASMLKGSLLLASFAIDDAIDNLVENPFFGDLAVVLKAQKSFIDSVYKAIPSKDIGQPDK